MWHFNGFVNSEKGEACEILVNILLVSGKVFTRIYYALRNALVVMAGEGYLAFAVFFFFFNKLGVCFRNLPNTQFAQ